MSFIKYFLWFAVLLLLGSCNFGRNGDDLSDDEVSFHDALNPELNFLNDAIEEDEKNGELYFKRAKVHYRLGSKGLALEDINKAIQLDNVKAPYYELLAIIYQKIDKPNLALNAAKKSEALNGANVRVWILLAQIHFDLKDFNKSQYYLTQAKSAAPNHADLYVIEGRLILQRKDSISAIPKFLRALQSNPTHEDAMNQLAIAYDQEGKEDSCMFYVWKGLQHHPKNPFFPYQMGTMLEKNKQEVSALSCYLTAVALDSAYYPAILKLADGYLRKENFSDALKWYQELVKYEPNHVQGNLQIAEILYQTGRENASMPYYRNVLLIEPDNVKAKSVYEKLLLIYPPEATYIPPVDTIVNPPVDSVKLVKPEKRVDTVTVKRKRKIPVVKTEVKEVINDEPFLEAPKAEENIPPAAEPTPATSPQ